MRTLKLLDDEVLIYLKDEWDSSLKNGDGVWLTTRALHLKLIERGVLTTWPTLVLRLKRLYKNNKILRINTSAGLCWGPLEEQEINNE